MEKIDKDAEIQNQKESDASELILQKPSEIYELDADISLPKVDGFPKGKRGHNFEGKNQSVSLASGDQINSWIAANVNHESGNQILHPLPSRQDRRNGGSVGAATNLLKSADKNILNIKNSSEKNESATVTKQIEALEGQQEENATNQSKKQAFQLDAKELEELKKEAEADNKVQEEKLSSALSEFQASFQMSDTGTANSNPIEEALKRSAAMKQKRLAMQQQKIKEQQEKLRQKSQESDKQSAVDKHEQRVDGAKKTLMFADPVENVLKQVTADNKMQKTLLNANRTKTMVQKRADPQNNLGGVAANKEARKKQLIEELQKQKTTKLVLNKPYPFVKELDYGQSKDNQNNNDEASQAVAPIVDFSKIDKGLKQDYFEGKLREMFVEQVAPIVTLAKKNLIHNASKNRNMIELKDNQNDLAKQISEAESGIATLVNLSRTVSAIEERSLLSQVEMRGDKESSKLDFRKIEKKVDEFTEKIVQLKAFVRERDHHIQDLRIELNLTKEQIGLNQQSTNQRISDEFKMRDEKFNALERKRKDMMSKVKGQTAHLDNLAAQIMDCEIAQKMATETIKSFKETEHQNVLNQVKELRGELLRQTTWYSDTNLKVDKFLKRLEPLHDRMRILEQYCQKSVPLMTHLQISDALQEFLCLPDQLKLIDFDNQRLDRLSKALNLDPLENQLAMQNDCRQDPESTNQNEKLSKKNQQEQLNNLANPANKMMASTLNRLAKDAKWQNMNQETQNSQEQINHSDLLNKRLEKLLLLMTEQKQGCIRFQFGRDWDINEVKSLEEAQDLGNLSYKKLLEHKRVLFETMMRKDRQVSLMDLAVDEARRRRYLKLMPFDKEETAMPSQDLDRGKHTTTFSQIQKTNTGLNSTAKNQGDDDEMQIKQESVQESFSNNYGPWLIEQTRQSVQSQQITLQKFNDESDQQSQRSLKYQSSDNQRGNNNKVQQDQQQQFEATEQIPKVIELQTKQKEDFFYRLIDYYSPSYKCGLPPGGEKQPSSYVQGIRIPNYHASCSSNNNNSGLPKVYRELVLLRQPQFSTNLKKSLARKGLGHQNNPRLAKLRQAQKRQKLSKNSFQNSKSSLQESLQQMTEEETSEQDSEDEASQLSSVIEDSGTAKNTNSDTDLNSRLTSEEQDQKQSQDQYRASNLDPNESRKSNLSPYDRQKSSKSPKNLLIPESRSNRGSVKIRTPSSKTLATPDKQSEKKRKTLNEKEIAIGTADRSLERRKSIKVSLGSTKGNKEFLSQILELKMTQQLSLKAFDKTNKELAETKLQLGQLKDLYGDKVQSLESEVKSHSKEISQLRGKNEKLKERVTEMDEDLFKKLEEVSQLATTSSQNMRQMMEKNVCENEAFKQYIMEEYVEFFRSKKKFHHELFVYQNAIDEKLNSYSSLMKYYDNNIKTLNQILPVLLEISSLQAAFDSSDIQMRLELTNGLKLSNLPNQGYLLTNVTNSLQKRQKSRESSIESQKKMRQISPDIPLDRQYGKGGLLPLSFEYREASLSVHEYRLILKDLIDLAKTGFTLDKAFCDPREYFDEAILRARDPTLGEQSSDYLRLKDTGKSVLQLEHFLKRNSSMTSTETQVQTLNMQSTAKTLLPGSKIQSERDISNLPIIDPQTRKSATVNRNQFSSKVEQKSRKIQTNQYQNANQSDGKSTQTQHITVRQDGKEIVIDDHAIKNAKALQKLSPRSRAQQKFEMNIVTHEVQKHGIPLIGSKTLTQFPTQLQGQIGSQKMHNYQGYIQQQLQRNSRTKQASRNVKKGLVSYHTVQTSQVHRKNSLGLSSRHGSGFALNRESIASNQKIQGKKKIDEPNFSVEKMTVSGTQQNINNRSSSSLKEDDLQQQLISNSQVNTVSAYNLDTQNGCKKVRQLKPWSLENTKFILPSNQTSKKNDPQLSQKEQSVESVRKPVRMRIQAQELIPNELDNMIRTHDSHSPQTGTETFTKDGSPNLLSKLMSQGPESQPNLKD